jgi:acetyl-CoA carboxylase biotin carboxyl carrier protein
LDLEELKELLQILEEKEIAEFELEEEGMKLRIRKVAANHSAAHTAMLTPLVSTVATVPMVAASAAPAPAAPAEAPPAEEAPPGHLVVRSPIVGTFYRAPDPNSPPYVNVGDHVRKGQVLCIIEAMKLMNEIEAEADGTVTDVHPESGQPVQYGDALFSLRSD